MRDDLLCEKGPFLGGGLEWEGACVSPVFIPE